MKLLKKLLRNRKGAAMVEYALLVAGIAVVSVAAVSILGHKTSDLLGTAAAIIPGVSDFDNDEITSGRLIETAPNADGALSVDVQGIIDNSETERLGNNLGYDPGELPSLVIPTTPN